MAGTGAAASHRATQGFVANVTWTWRHPWLTLIEVGWRWLFGGPLLVLCWFLGRDLLSQVPWQGTGVQQVSANQLLTDPMGATGSLIAFMQLVSPGLIAIARWLVPLACVVWMLLSATGRTLLLRRMDKRLRPQWRTVRGLQAFRVAAAALTVWLWWKGVQAIGWLTITRHVLNGGDPRVLQYAAGVIALSLGLFVLSGALNWVFTAAPILAMMHGTGVFASLSAAARAHGARSGMAEINLVLNVVKIMLIVLGMAFSAFPLPFTNVVTDEYVLIWSGLVALWYFATSDFFHVTRLHAFTQLLRRRELTQAAVAASE